MSIFHSMGAVMMVGLVRFAEWLGKPFAFEQRMIDETKADAIRRGDWIVRAMTHTGIDTRGSAERELPKLMVTRGDGVPLPDQAQALRDFKAACQPSKVPERLVPRGPFKPDDMGKNWTADDWNDRAMLAAQRETQGRPADADRYEAAHPLGGEERHMTPAETFRDSLKRQGIDPARVMKEETPRETIERLAREAGLGPGLILSDAEHAAMDRARVDAATLGIGAYQVNHDGSIEYVDPVGLVIGVDHGSGDFTAITCPHCRQSFRLERKS